jgi:hypothetical protein
MGQMQHSWHAMEAAAGILGLRTRQFQKSLGDDGAATLTITKTSPLRSSSANVSLSRDSPPNKKTAGQPRLKDTCKHAQLRCREKAIMVVYEELRREIIFITSGARAAGSLLSTCDVRESPI